MLSAYRLAGPLPGEKVVTILHRDIFIVLKRILLFIVLLALPVALLFMLNRLFPALNQGLIVWPIIVMSASAYLLFIWLLFFFSIIDYLLDVWIITDQRIIDIRQSGFFSRTISELRLSRIQDITSDVSGVWATIFKYGNLKVQTAAQEEKFHFEEVGHPERVRDLLIRLSSVHEAAPAPAPSLSRHEVA